MENYFKNSLVLDSDCYVADYTKSTGSRKGVVISLVPFPDIAYFHLKKRNKGQSIPYIAVNLEEYCDFIAGAENCECLFSSLRDEGRSWILFLETKYCGPDNIERYTFKAHSQMKETLCKLESMGLVDRSKKRIYFAYSVPGHDERSPFGSFTFSQNETLQKLEDENIRLLPYNTVVIATPEYLFQPIK